MVALYLHENLALLVQIAGGGSGDIPMADGSLALCISATGLANTRSFRRGLAVWIAADWVARW